ncbi:efflux RND transporter periplasmic adaptor subunit [Brucepastera parasyntrophica]|uniref:efflux RND transporter periplasmic adaptor subunit n=1 Tax=Brucepastera parasyntrophica TaxID=2880008 RepID=UPI002109BAF9|nr:efflux RND transporter periplasmic adaptor subunit [Brucepastera parasyntrophica]ULQ58739.1 efflux RND transporter periplasmic adaptor subunit [Brucepastera parasyntrophica]
MADKTENSLFDRIVKIILLILIGICVIYIGVAVFSNILKGNGQEASGPAAVRTALTGVITVEAVTISPATIIQTIRLNGDISSRSQISLYPDTSGKLVQYEKNVGDPVRTGDIVALVDPSRPGAAYTASPVRSTINGTIISLPYTIGETVSTTSPIATVGRLNDLEIITHVPEKYIAVLRTGLPASVTLAPYPDEVFGAVVDQVSPVVDVSSRTVEIHLRITSTGRDLKPGMFAVVTLVTQQASGTMVVPKTAVRTYNNTSVVYTIDEDSIAHRREIVTGLTNDNEVQILAGISLGDQVVVSGSISEGTPVRVLSQDTEL